MPLQGRAALQQGETVLVLGATGASGSLAVRIALHLGAGHVIAAGRNVDVLARLGQDERVTAVTLDDLPDALSNGVDVVLDYLWGSVAESALEALRRTGLDHVAGLTRYVQIGALAGRTVALDAAPPAAVVEHRGLGQRRRLDRPARADDRAAQGHGARGVRRPEPPESAEVALPDIADAWSSSERLVVVI